LKKKIRNTKLGTEELHDLYCPPQSDEIGWACNMRVIGEECIVF